MPALYRPEALTQFLVQAKRQTYAGQGDDASVSPLLPGTRQLEYCDGDFFIATFMQVLSISSARKSCITKISLSGP